MRDERDKEIAKLREEVADLRKMVRALVSQVEHLTAENGALRTEVAVLRTENEELRVRLGQNSSNSSKPPSSDSPADRAARPGKPPSGRSRGGQPGRKGSQRTLLTPTTPPTDCFPPSCRRCGKGLPRRSDDDPRRHQVVDLPPITPDVSEWRLHRVRCRDCGTVTCGKLPAGVPQGMCGPGLMALIGLLTGDYNMSRRRAVGLLRDVLGIEISLGALSEAEEGVSEAVAAPVAEAAEHVAEQKLKHSDATGWLQRGQARTLWTIATAAVTVFFITPDGSMAGLRGLFAKIKGILVSDRGRQFGFWAMKNRQICWAHLMRKFADFAERPGPAGEIGQSLLDCARVVMHCWHRVRDGTMPRSHFRVLMSTMRPVIEHHLTRGVRLSARGISGSCADILGHAEAMWTFVDVAGVEPTNNHAEQELRSFVLWRKRSFGSQSDRGCRFAERIMTVTHSLRKQKRHVLSYLTQACQAALRGQTPPSLVMPGP